MITHCVIRWSTSVIGVVRKAPRKLGYKEMIVGLANAVGVGQRFWKSKRVGDEAKVPSSSKSHCLISKNVCAKPSLGFLMR